MTRVRILCGPKRSGRPAAFDTLLLKHWPRAFVVTPTAAHGRLTTERLLLDNGQGGAWGKRVANFPQFVEALLASYGERTVRIGEFERVRLVQGLLDDLASEGVIAAAGASAATPGFRNQVLRAIVELKQAAVEPDRFRKALGKTGAVSPYHELLATVYERYQDALLARGAYDTVGLYWRAEILARSERPPLLADTELLALDGFDDFTPSELRLVKTLAAHVDTAAFSLAFDHEDDTQGTLHGLLHETLDTLRRVFPGAEVERFQEHPPETTGHYAARFVFAIEDPPPPGELSTAVHFVACGSPAIEREHLARRVKLMLVDEQQPADAIAVCIPQLTQHLGPIRRAFEDAGVPFRLRDERPVSECAAARFLAEVLRAPRTWSAGDVSAVLSSPWLDATQGTDGRRHTALVVRKALIIGGREQWARRLEGYRGRLTEHDAQHSDRRHFPGLPDAVKALQSRLAWLIEQADALADARQERALAGALIELLLALEPGAMLQSMPDDQRPAETAALRALFEGLGRARQSTHETPIADASAWFDDLCVHTKFQRGGAGAGVLITDPEGIRHLSFRCVLFAGLNEGVLPGKRATDPLFSEGERRVLREQGLALEDREHHARREMTLFHRVLEAAGERIELSWSIADADGRERYPSPFVQEVRRLLPGAATPVVIAELYPPPVEAVTKAEVFGCAFGAGAMLQPAAQRLDPALFERTQRGSAMEADRYHGEGFGPFDGVLKEDASHAALRARYGDGHTWSVAQFETYNDCPMLFFLKAVLRIQEPEEPKEELPPKVRGQLVHKALERFLFTHPTRRLDAIGPADAPRMESVIDEVFQDRQGHPELRCVPPGVLAAERGRMKEELRRFLRIQSEWEENAGWLAESFELAFGRPDSEYGPFELILGDGVITVSGIIDRVDRNEAGDARLIDYKTRSLPEKWKMDSGHLLQLGVYALAWEQHLNPGSDCTAAGYLRPDRAKSEGWRDALGKTPEDREARREAVLSRIDEVVFSVRNGHFAPVLAKDANLYGYKRAVRHESGRIDRKTGTVSDDED